MLTEDILKLAGDIAATASYSNKGFAAKPQGPIATLLGTLPTVLEAGSDEDITRASLERLSVIGSHEQVQRGIVTVYARVICNIVDAARNTVKPLVDSIFRDIQEERTRALMFDTGLYREIVQVITPRILYDAQFAAMVSEYKDVTYPNVNSLNEILSVIYDELAPTEIMQLALTGSSEIDSKLREVYGEEISRLDFKYDTSSYAIPLRAAITVFMLLNGVINYRTDKLGILVDNPEALSKVLMMRNTLGAAIYRLLTVYTNDIDNGHMFCNDSRLYSESENVRTDDSKVYVYSELYRDWTVNKGGSIEALLGYVCAAKEKHAVLDEKVLSNDIDGHLAFYSRKQHSVDLSKALSDIEVVKKTAHRELERYINDTYCKSEAEFTMYHTRAKYAVEHDYHGPADLEAYLIKLVARTLYPARGSADSEINKSDVKDILLEVHSQTVNVENPNYEEALLLAMVRLICKTLTHDLVLV
jgi:hypothetical protein